MQNRIRIIFLLMTACILGFIVFQGYWLYNAYELAYNQFNFSINSALREAVNKKIFHDIAEYSENNPHEVQDTLFERGRWYLIASKLKERPYDMQYLDSVFYQELEERGFQNTQFTLDSQSMKRPFPRRRHTRVDTLEVENLESISNSETRWIRVNMAGNLHVRASFQKPYNYLYGKLFGVLLVTLILLFLTIGSFIYMLRTILKQKRLSEIKSDFISNMTHELKTPIATVSAAIEALQHFNAMEDKNKAKTYLDISSEELNRLSGLVDKVLHNSVEENGGMQINRTPTDLNALVTRIIKSQKLKNSKNIIFDYNNRLENNWIEVDEVHFSNAINNIVENAIKYSGDEVEVAILMEDRPNNKVRIQISDNGIGIPDKFKKQVFEKFFRVPTGNIHNVKGYGLGLSYVRNVVTRHDGTITIKDGKKGGSRFIIEITRSN